VRLWEFFFYGKEVGRRGRVFRLSFDNLDK
jgi:hypothetical protein